MSPAKMITVDCGELRTLVTHVDCPDGIASAILFLDAIPNIDIHFMAPSSPALKHLVPTPGMIFCDLCPPKDRAQLFVDAGTYVLDHHKTAKETIALFGERGLYDDDPTSCGAVLALENVWLPVFRSVSRTESAQTIAQATRFAALAAIRDTWQRGNPLFNQALKQGEMLLGYTWADWVDGETSFSPESMFAPFTGQLSWWREKNRGGELLWRRTQQEVERTLSNGFDFVSRGYRCFCFQGAAISSLVAETIRTRELPYDLVIAFDYLVRNRQIDLRVSMRSNSEFDCAEFAKKLGGGGHTSAAGFTLVPDEHIGPFRAIQECLAAGIDESRSRGAK